MATKYKRAGAGNWETDASWSTTSGGAADTVAPLESDDAVLDANSGNCYVGTGGGVCKCRSLNCTGYTGFLDGNSVTVTIGDGTAGAGNIALKFVAGMTHGSVIYTFVSTSATVQTIDFAGKTTLSVTFNATSGGSWKYTGAHTTTSVSTVTLTKGTLDINGQTCSWGLFSSDNANVRSLTLGAANITITGTGTVWSFLTPSNATVSANNSGCTITLTGSGVNFYGGSGFTYNDLVHSGASTFYVSTTAVFRNVTRTASATKTCTLTLGANLVCSGTFTSNGNSNINRVHVLSDTVGTARTITAATVTVSNTDFQDITGAGAGSWDFSARTDIGDCGGNSGITFPAGVNQYYGGVNLNGGYLRMNAISVNYVSSPDSVPLSITADIDLQARLSADDWTPAGNQTILAKWRAIAGKRSFRWDMDNACKLILNISADGSTAATATSSTATGFTDGTPYWVRVTYVKSTGVVQFFTAADSAGVPASWTQLGTDISTIPANTAIYDSDQQLEVGSYGDGIVSQFVGKYYRSRVLNGVGGTVVFDADFTAQAAGTKSFTESSANAATVSLVVTGGNWSASSWTTRVPLPQDNCFMGNAFAASQTVVSDMPRLCKSVSWVGATGSPTWNFGSVANTIYGSIDLTGVGTITGTQTLTLGGRG